MQDQRQVAPSPGYLGQLLLVAEAVSVETSVVWFAQHPLRRADIIEGHKKAFEEREQ